MNVGKKVTGKKVTEKKSQIWVGKKVTGKKVTKKNYDFSQLLVRIKHFYFYYYHNDHFMFCLDLCFSLFISHLTIFGHAGTELILTGYLTRIW